MKLKHLTAVCIYPHCLPYSHYHRYSTLGHIHVCVLTRHCEASDTMVRCFNLVSCVGEREGRDAASPEGGEKEVKSYDLSEVCLV